MPRAEPAVPETSPPRFPFRFDGDRIAPELAEMAGHRPVREVVTNTGTRAWLVAGYDEVRAVLRDRRFSLSLTSDPACPRQDPLYPPLTATDTLSYFQRGGMLSALHRGLGPTRRHLTEAETAGHVRRVLRPFLDREEQPADLVTGFVFPVSRALTFALLGLTEDGCPDDDVLFGIFRTGTGSDEVVPECWEKGRTYLSAQLPRLRERRTGLLGELIALADSRRTLSDDELLDLFLFLFISQYGNPATFLGAAFPTLMRHPQLVTRLRADPELLPRAVEELLRWTVFLGDGLPRIAREDVTVGDVRVRRGELVLVSTDGANHDPRVFPDPHRLDVDRPHNPHLRFSDGRHRCPGKSVASFQAEVTLRVLLEETEDIRLAVPCDAVDWRPFHAVTLPRSLPVRWRRRSAPPR
ncbi:cytochrome P450 [Streptomyces sp. CRN 30]|uniref:cytochrome P450 n=1 Tax=Streptomyces sp. CRN 30 TaxID=3075613 RepID=UPI002A8268E1|nr:cytochrome P450 [Streptomyces sp. CRN 30]